MTAGRKKVLFVNTIVKLKSKEVHTVREGEYCLVEGARNNKKNLIFFGVISNSPSKFIRCYVYNLAMRAMQSIPSSKVGCQLSICDFVVILF